MEVKITLEKQKFIPKQLQLSSNGGKFARVGGNSPRVGDKPWQVGDKPFCAARKESFLVSSHLA
ncbi:hypothetical protein M3152_01105 [Sporosarcina luteola]|uniref:hypothetical protein n=1 Tax=Bacillales TaxID=1385 RepID=UPI00203EE79E|nr:MULTISPECIES: hypothetical protein [Bacillales]MCM3636299.1 hypothetical protein [Sporosarcina luteola]